MKKHPKIRLTGPQHTPRLLEDGIMLSREQALLRIGNLLSGPKLHPEALRLIDLFRIEAEELAEAGVSFEMLKVLEQRALFF